MSTHWVHWGSYGHVLAVRLRTLRVMRGLSQLRLAELSGLSRNVISNLERNENSQRTPTDPVLSTVYRLAWALDVPPAALLPGVAAKVADVCDRGSAADLAVDVRWPGPPEDLAPFSTGHLVLGELGDTPQY